VEKQRAEEQKKKEEEDEAFLREHPEERERRQLQSKFEAYPNVVAYIFAIFTWKRPIEFAVLCALALLVEIIFLWLDVTLLTLLFLGLSGIVWTWWISDLVIVKLSWEKLLGPNPDPTVAYDFIIQVNQYLNTLYNNNREQNKLKMAAIWLLIALIGYFLNENLLLIITLLAAMCAPGVLNRQFNKWKLQAKKNS